MQSGKSSLSWSSFGIRDATGFENPVLTDLKGEPKLTLRAPK
jgi:hypothetical protein